jgi:PAS domain S-box-containing protein
MTRLADSFEKDLMAAWLDSSGLGFCVIDNTSQVVSANAAFCEALGTTPEQAIGQSIRSLFAAVNASANFVNWLGSADASSERTLFTSHNGVTRHLLHKLTPLRFHTGDLFKVLSVTDITQLYTTQQQLEQNSRRWQAMNAGVVISDAKSVDMPIVFINRAFEEMSGYTATEVIGRNCRFLQNDDKQPEALAELRQAIANGTNGYALLRNYRKDGSMFLNELFISPIRGLMGEVTHFIGVQHIRRESPRELEGAAHVSFTRVG